MASQGRSKRLQQAERSGLSVTFVDEPKPIAGATAALSVEELRHRPAVSPTVPSRPPPRVPRIYSPCISAESIHETVDQRREMHVTRFRCPYPDDLDGRSASMRRPLAASTLAEDAGTVAVPWPVAATREAQQAARRLQGGIAAATLRGEAPHSLPHTASVAAPVAAGGGLAAARASRKETGGGPCGEPIDAAVALSGAAPSPPLSFAAAAGGDFCVGLMRRICAIAAGCDGEPPLVVRAGAAGEAWSSTGLGGDCTMSQQHQVGAQCGMPEMAASFADNVEVSQQDEAEGARLADAARRSRPCLAGSLALHPMPVLAPAEERPTCLDFHVPVRTSLSSALSLASPICGVSVASSCASLDDCVELQRVLESMCSHVSLLANLKGVVPLPVPDRTPQLSPQHSVPVQRSLANAEGSVALAAAATWRPLAPTFATQALPGTSRPPWRQPETAVPRPAFGESSALPSRALQAPEPAAALPMRRPSSASACGRRPVLDGSPAPGGPGSSGPSNPPLCHSRCPYQRPSTARSPTATRQGPCNVEAPDVARRHDRGGVDSLPLGTGKSGGAVAAAVAAAAAAAASACALHRGAGCRGAGCSGSAVVTSVSGEVRHLGERPSFLIRPSSPAHAPSLGLAPQLSPEASPAMSLVASPLRALCPAPPAAEPVAVPFAAAAPWPAAAPAPTRPVAPVPEPGILACRRRRWGRRGGQGSSASGSSCAEQIEAPEANDATKTVDVGNSAAVSLAGDVIAASPPEPAETTFVLPPMIFDSRSHVAEAGVCTDMEAVCSTYSDTVPAADGVAPLASDFGAAVAEPQHRAWCSIDAGGVKLGNRCRGEGFQSGVAEHCGEGDRSAGTTADAAIFGGTVPLAPLATTALVVAEADTDSTVPPLGTDSTVLNDAASLVAADAAEQAFGAALAQVLDTPKEARAVEGIPDTTSETEALAEASSPLCVVPTVSLPVAEQERTLLPGQSPEASGPAVVWTDSTAADRHSFVKGLCNGNAADCAVTGIVSGGVRDDDQLLPPLPPPPLFTMPSTMLASEVPAASCGVLEVPPVMPPSTSLAVLRTWDPRAPPLWTPSSTRSGPFGSMPSSAKKEEALADGDMPDVLTLLPEAIAQGPLAGLESVVRPETTSTAPLAHGTLDGQYSVGSVTFSTPQRSPELDGWDVELVWTQGASSPDVSRLEIVIGLAPFDVVASALLASGSTDSGGLCRRGTLLWPDTGDLLAWGPLRSPGTCTGSQGQDETNPVAQLVPAAGGSRWQPTRVRLRGVPAAVPLHLQLIGLSEDRGLSRSSFLGELVLLRVPATSVVREVVTALVSRDAQWDAGFRVCPQTLKVTEVDECGPVAELLRPGDVLRAVGSRIVSAYEEYRSEAYSLSEFTLELERPGLPYNAEALLRLLRTGSGSLEDEPASFAGLSIVPAETTVSLAVPVMQPLPLSTRRLKPSKDTRTAAPRRCGNPGPSCGTDALLKGWSSSEPKRASMNVH